MAFSVALVALALASMTSAQPTRSAAGTQSSLSPSELAERALHRRAVEAVIWGMPAVNYDLMYQAAVRGAKGSFNQVIYWSRLADWKIQTLTPNPDAIYCCSSSTRPCRTSGEPAVAAGKSIR